MEKFSSIKAFVATVEAGSFAAAARALGLSRSQVSKRVMALEEHLGAQLLNRSTRHVATTSDGLAFYERAGQILDDLTEAELAISKTSTVPTGRLRISAPLSLGSLNFSNLITDFMLQYPQCQVELTLDARMVDPISEGFDCVIRISKPDEEAQLVDHRLAKVDYITCASKSYLEKRGIPNHPHELTTHDLLHYPGSSNRRFWNFTGFEGPVSVPVKPVLKSNNLDPLRSAVIAGLGIAIIPRYCVAEQLRSGQVVCILREYGTPSFMLQLIYPPSRHLSTKVQAFTDFLQKRFEHGIN